MSKYTEMQEQFTREKLDNIVLGLHRMADEIERDRGNKNLGFAVSNATNTILWGVANLGLGTLQDNLTRYHEAKQAELQGRVEELEAP